MERLPIGRISCRRCRKKGHRQQSAFQSAGRVALISLMGLVPACSPLGAFNTLVPKDTGGTLLARAVAYGEHPRQRLDIYRPSSGARVGRSLGAQPIIIFLYGGSWQSGDREGYAFVGRALAQRGFMVVIPDYRLVPEVRFPAFLQDNVKAFSWARANAARFGGDPSKIVLVGHSAGAYNAAMLALDPQWLGGDRSAIRGMVGLAGPYDFLPLSGAITTAAFGHHRNPAETQPINFASEGDPPALLLHGLQDNIVYQHNSSRLAEKLQASGVDSRVKLYKDVGHIGILTALARPFRGRASVLEDISTFAWEVTTPTGPAMKAAPEAEGDP